ncbi:lysine decarboxylase [Alcanivorax hongdengensis A-11-3]|uniref:Cytokinin riboside 5'-monophosphate phosphoribohydrolase n=1 Tax=Alcanivorax hongdengensis A-11-3 TaxID=1177179 RepID=L0WCG0_9GAMM|nr:TIGR00730 family Rossman fold protein [Alcanivorax hongdengensis]EKF73410.1 lysine decarboxylase [Alcanivorax hongdengensis A-11-3]
MQTLCVYCGSSPGNGSRYIQAAADLASELVARDITLVYGGASVGTMGALANAMMSRGGRVIGIIPDALMHREIGNDHVTELKIVRSMHERKAAMAELADGFIALPGGMGTLEEIFEILTWAQLGFHHKPCALLNVDGYYDHLTTFLDHAVTQGFLKPWHHKLLQVHNDPASLLDSFRDYQPPQVTTWIRKQEQL